MSRWTDYTEPARIRAVVAAVVGLALALGITLPFDLPGIVEAGLPLLALIIPLVQGEATRAVVSPAKGLPSQATPGPDHAA